MRPLRILSLAFFALLAIAAAVLGWLTFSEAAPRWLAQVASERSAGRLTIEGVDGRLLGPLRAARIAWRDAGTTVEVDQAVVEWTPGALLGGRIAVRRLTAKRIDVALAAASDAPLRLPPSLELPLPLRVDAVEVAEIMIRPHAGAQPEKVGGLRFALTAGRDAWQVAGLRLQYRAWTLGGNASLAAQAPFGVEGAFDLDGKLEGIELKARLAVTGILEALQLKATAQAAQSTATVTAMLRPLDAQPLREVKAQLAGLNPAQWQKGAPQADIGVDLAVALDAAGSLRGEYALANAQPGALDAKKLPLAAGRGAFSGRLGELQFDALAADLAGGGKLSGTGRIQAGRMELALKAARVDLSAVSSALLQTRLDGDLSLSVVPEADAPALQATFDLRDSRNHAKPIHGKGSVELRGRRLAQADFTLRLADNTLQAAGRLGEPGDSLTWRLDAPRLDALGPGFGGRLQASGTLTGRYDDPALAFELNGRRLAFPGGHAFGAVEASGRLKAGADDALRLDARADDIASGGQKLKALRLQASGTRRRNDIDLTLDVAGSRIVAALSGSYAEGAWKGRLNKLDGSGRHAFALRAPAELAVSAQRQSARGLQLDFTGGAFTLEVVEHEQGRLKSAGAAQGVPLAWLLPDATAQAVASTVTLGAQWSLAAGQSVDGSARLWREQGDVRVWPEAGPALGLQQAEAQLRAADGRLSGTLVLRGSELGRLDVEAEAGLAQSQGRWGIAADAPLQMRARGAMPDLAWLARLAPRLGLESAGSLELDARASGTPRRPQLSGALRGAALALRMPTEGVDLHEGVLEVQFDADRIALSRFTLKGGEGSLTAQGEMTLGEAARPAQATLRLDRLQLVSQPERQLILSGETKLDWSEAGAVLAGKLRADRGLIVLPEAGTPVLGEDVVVAGREKPQEDGRPPVKAKIDLALDLGDDFRVRGSGLDARLAGELRLRATHDTSPTAHGSIRVAAGSYSAYGQKLAIERGVLSFAGPVDNPGLDIVALRKNQTVEAGVEIRGTAQAPSVRLVSNPSVPDSDKLSWLVLGRGIDDAGQGNLGLLNAAAGALLGSSQAASLQARMAYSLGLDELSLSGEGLEGTVLTLGKRISSDVRLSVEQAVTGTGTLVGLHYQLGRGFSVRTRAGSETAVDLFYTWSFD
ncbi:MAG: hypothetical protein CVU20_07470 [Betaproteobacteria bacterium HGW-Betaproteobacteria-14]|nr:MAG: hypothetical protein CVU20_07470 [Betaproteobacteria bacterium HGW-Betaproteobacteria-14]